MGTWEPKLQGATEAQVYKTTVGKERDPSVTRRCSWQVAGFEIAFTGKQTTQQAAAGVTPRLLAPHLAPELRPGNGRALEAGVGTWALIGDEWGAA